MTVRRAHPRSRGENSLMMLSNSSHMGSSPLTRGKRLPGHGQWLPPGLIPAHAGKTASRDAHSSEPTAHPRSRGENTSNPASASARAGSSPLTRGKRTEGENRSVLSGLIPAHAGKTPCFWADCPCGRAHPRSRGENDPGGRRQVGAGGSSPLTRGKPAPKVSVATTTRLIPAHAGKTTLSWAIRRP